MTEAEMIAAARGRDYIFRFDGVDRRGRAGTLLINAPDRAQARAAADDVEAEHGGKYRISRVEKSA